MTDFRAPSVAAIVATTGVGLTVLLGANGPQRVRAVAHLDVDREAVLRAAKVIAQIVAR